MRRTAGLVALVTTLSAMVAAPAQAAGKPATAAEITVAADAPLPFAEDPAEYNVATYGRYTVVSRRDTSRLGIYRREERGGTTVYRLTDALDLPYGAPVESMMVDSTAGVLYAAQENVALWRIRLDADHFAGVPRVVRAAERPA